MNNLNISSVNSISTVRKVLRATNISPEEKTQFLIKNKNEISELVEISSNDYAQIMKNRPLQLFKPIKNSFTKRGDKILLAKALNISPSEVNRYIENVSEDIKKVNNIDYLPRETIDKIKTYIFRHGNADQLVNFLDYELKNAKDITKEIYKTLDYNNEGVADYFVRPIHRMTNHTLVTIYNTIDKNIDECVKNGKLNEADSQKTAEWAFVQLCKIKNNQKLINAIKMAKTLK